MLFSSILELIRRTEQIFEVSLNPFGAIVCAMMNRFLYLKVGRMYVYIKNLPKYIMLRISLSSRKNSLLQNL